MAPLVVAMGVAGCGKTTVGRQLARILDAEFLEGDELQPERNVERMAMGIALTAADRRNWLLEIAQQLADARAGRHALVVACTALQRGDRDLLQTAASHLAFVYLAADHEVLESRLPPGPAPQSMLCQQLQALEPPGAEERALVLDAALQPADLARQAADWLARWKPEPGRKK